MAEISFDKVVGYLFIIDSMTLETHEAPLWFAPRIMLDGLDGIVA